MKLPTHCLPKQLQPELSDMSQDLQGMDHMTGLADHVTKLLAVFVFAWFLQNILFLCTGNG